MRRRGANRAPTGLRIPKRMSAVASMLPSVTTLRDPLNRVLGKRTAQAIEDAFGLKTAGDLLRHYPRRYYTRGELTDLASLREGDHVTVVARIETARVIRGYAKDGKRPLNRLEVV